MLKSENNIIESVNPLILKNPIQYDLPAGDVKFLIKSSIQPKTVKKKTPKTLTKTSTPVPTTINIINNTFSDSYIQKL